MRKRLLAVIGFLFIVNLPAQSGKIYFSGNKGTINGSDTPVIKVYDLETGRTKTFQNASVPGRGEGSLAFSPDGSKVIFNTYRYSGWKLGVGSLKNGKITNIKRFTGRSNYEYNANWSSDGKRVVYQEYNWGTSKNEMFIKDMGTGKVTKVLDSPGADRIPYWAAGDSKIVFTSVRNGNYDIHSVDIDGNNITNLTKNRSHNFALSVNSQQDKIAFLSNRTGSIHLYTMNLDGSDLRDLTPELKTGQLQGNTWQNTSSWAFGSSWSPDGEWVVFNVPYEGNTEMFIVKSDGSALKRITNDDSAELVPTWSTY